MVQLSNALFRSYRRTAVVALTSSLLLTITLTLPGQAAEPFVNGNTKATATIARVAPGVGNLELATTMGTAVTQTQNQLAQAQAQTFDMGLLGTALTTESCSGGEGTIKAEDLPQPTRVDNRRGRAEASADDAPVAGSTFGGGRARVEADTGPGAHAIAEASGGGIPPAVTLEGGRAESRSRVLDGAREARADVVADMVVAEVVRFEGMHWEALHRTGANAERAGAFTLDGVEALGVALPVDDLDALEDALNTALEESGITLRFPTVHRLKEPTDLVRVTPMRIELRDSPLGAAALGPLLGLSREQREEFFDQMTAQDCRLASPLLVGDIALSVVSGTGFIAFDVGGAEATTAEVRYVDPFGGPGAPVATNAPAARPDEDGRPAAAAGGTTDPGTANPDGGSSGAPVTGAPEVLAAAPVRTERRCESAHPFRWPPCSEGAALPVGVAGIVGTGVVAFLDWRNRRAGPSLRATG